MAEKIKVLAWGDYVASTGFGTVMRHIMQSLQNSGKYDIHVVGVNYDGGPYDTEKWPGTLWPAISALRTQGPYGDVFGRQVFLDLLAQGDYDVVFIVQDTFIVLPIVPQILELQRQKPKTFASIYYYPFDCSPMESWVRNCAASFDFPVAYTEYAKNESRKFIGNVADKHDVIYHGTNTDNFHPLPKEEVDNLRKMIFPQHHDRFIITNVNRNQGRKDISRSLMVLKQLLEMGVDNAFLYLHMQETDFGGSLTEMATTLGLQQGIHYTFPDPSTFGAHSGFPIEFVNVIYNVSDCFLTTCHGEGWGLSITEAMATKLPVVAPNNTSIPEILGDDRGWRVPSGANPGMWVIKENDNSRARPLMDVEEAANTIKYIMDNPDEAARRAENAYAWIQENTWDAICEQWIGVFNKATNKAKGANLLKAKDAALNGGK